MALKAVKRTGEDSTQPIENGGVHMETNNTPVTQGANALQPAADNAGKTVIEEVNNGILENIEGMTGTSVSFVSFVDGEFLFKESNEGYKEIDILVVHGKRIFQKYDEEENRYITAETKLDDTFKFKFEVTFVLADQDADPEDEAPQYKITLPTASAMLFVKYVEKLAKQKRMSVDQVVTKMTSTKQQNKAKQRYNRVAFEAFNIENPEQSLGIKQA